MKPQEMGTLSERAIAISAFSLCSFANFLSIAIQLAVTGSLAPINDHYRQTGT